MSFAAEAMYNSTENDKGKYIENTYGYTSTKQNTKKNNYNAHIRIFDHSTPEDMLL